MNTLFGVLLILAALLYSVRLGAWLTVVFNSKIREKAFTDNKISKTAFYWGGLEHIFYMVTLIGAAILLLF